MLDSDQLPRSARRIEARFSVRRIMSASNGFDGDGTRLPESPMKTELELLRDEDGARYLDPTDNEFFNGSDCAVDDNFEPLGYGGHIREVGCARRKVRLV
ncbi:hypothetical protein M5689_000704 [Euphorbia peplus]|nr:hypothetical protein M5689_000704 [Euphorbia peplus]